jgi:ATP-binding cassette subfamily C protein CydD
VFLDKRLLKWVKDLRIKFILPISAEVLLAFFIIIEAVYLSVITEKVFLQNRSLEDIFPELAGFFLISILRVLTSWQEQKRLSYTGSVLKTHLQSRLINRIHESGPSGLPENSAAELSTLYTGHVDAIVRYVTEYMPHLVRALVIPVVILVWIFPLDLITGFILLLTAPLIPLFMILIGSMTETATHRRWQQLARMRAYFFDVLQGLTTIRIFGRPGYFLERIRKTSEDFRSGSMRVLRIAFLSALVMELLTTISMAVIAVEIGLRLLYGSMIFRDAFFILILAPDFYQPMRLLGGLFHNAVAGSAAADRYERWLSSGEKQIVSPAENTGRAEAVPIRFENVSCRYPQRSEPALNAITITIPPVGLTVVSGPSGAGKSTLLALLMRFVEPMEGRILLGKTPLEDLHPRRWRRQTAWISQDPYLFNRTILENIALAKPGASRSEIESATRSAGLTEVIEQLPHGLDTPVGEQGLRLSAGERQRVALARVFLRNAPYVFMDEPTASLDPHTDYLIRRSIEVLSEDRLVMVISHRPEIKSKAALVLALSDGRLAAKDFHKFPDPNGKENGPDSGGRND